MLDHRYSLDDLIHRIADIINDDIDDRTMNAHAMLGMAFDIFESEVGFQGFMIWACKDEFEGFKDDMKLF